MRQTKSEATAKVEFVQSPEGMYEQLREWRKEHPLASFDEIPEETRRER